MITIIHKISRHVHCSGQGIKTWSVMQKTISVHSQQQSPFSRLTLIVHKGHGPDCPEACVRTFRRHMSSRWFAAVRNPHSGQFLNLGSLTTQFPICSGAYRLCDCVQSISCRCVSGRRWSVLFSSTNTRRPGEASCQPILCRTRFVPNVQTLSWCQGRQPETCSKAC